MTIDIITYDPKYLEQHVELGKRLTQSWRYFGQTPLHILRQQYNAPEFDGSTRLYAIDTVTDTLMGFHTAEIIEPGFARVEFPIVDPNYPDLVDQLYDRQMEILKKRGVRTIQSRASKFWGDTSMYVEKYGYSHDRDLYFVTTERPENLLEENTLEELEFQFYDGKKHQQQVKKILMENFDCSEQLADSYIENYEKSSSGLTLHQLVVDEDGGISGRITLSNYLHEERELVFATVYTHPESDELLPALLGYLDREISEKFQQVDEFTCYISGMARENLSKYLDSSGIDPALSFWTRKIE